MFGLLRLIRGFCGVLSAIQVMNLFTALTWLQQPDADSGFILAQVFIRVIIVAFFGWLFFWLRGFINRLHTKKHGTLHPSLAKNKWAF